MALTRVTSGGIAPGVVIKFDSNNTPTAPAISFENSLQTGIYSPDTDEIAISTAGQTRMSIDSAGKLSLSNGTFLPVTDSNSTDSVNVTLYVSQSDSKASDASDNAGTNINRPFKTIERALLEAARRSYVPGASNDKFEAFTVMVMPGDYTIDNRPGYDSLANPIGGDSLEDNIWRFNPRNGGVIVPRGTSIVGYDLRKTIIRPKYVPKPFSDLGSNVGDNYAIAQIMYDAANMIIKNRGYIQEQTILYLQQSTDSLSGSTVSNLYNALSADKKELCKRDLGYIIDSIVSDLRNGGNASSYNAGQFYTDGTNNINLAGNEKALTVAAFEYARNIAVNALNNFPSTQPTGFTYTERSGTIAKTTFAAGVDYTVGDCSDANSAVNQLIAVITTIINNPSDYSSYVKKTLGVYEPTAIFKLTGGCYMWQMTFKDAKGTGSTGSYSGVFNTVSYDLNGVPTFGALTQTDYETNGIVNYSHHRVIAFTYADQRTSEGELETYYSKIDGWDTSFDGGSTREARVEEYRIVGDSSLRTQIDTVNSCSPYIFNCSLRSTHGLNGMWADGSKVQPNSFKSMVVAQFTGISLQRDSNCFWQPRAVDGIPTSTTNPTTGDESTQLPIYADPDAEYKQNCRHFHIKASNGAFIQVVSVFAVGYADQFIAETGGDMSITNSNSNFGQVSLRAVGHQFDSFEPANQGKITALVPPRGIDNTLQVFEIAGIDARTTWEKNGYPVDPTLNFIEYSVEAKNNFTFNEQNQFKIYLDIPSINSEEDIPELELSAKDNLDGTLVTKRYFLYGSGNLALFRDYHSIEGTVRNNYATIDVVVDNESGGQTTYTATVKLSDPNATGANAERQGYFFDDGGIYLILDNSFGNTRNFISEFLFRTTTRSIFTTTTETLQDGSVVVSSAPKTTEVLEYSTSFPAPVVTRKYVDTRGSTPSDLIWRVEYTIPKDCAVTPKPPEKRFVIKGTRSSNGLDGVPYTDYRFSVLDVEEVQAWSRDQKDGIYYLTVIRADVDKFVDWFEGSFLNKPINLTRGTYSKYDNISEFYNNNIDYRSSSNINYLYPSIDEEGLPHRSNYLWNPPQIDSRVLVEKVGNGFRPKDLSVPNRSEYVSKISDIVSIVADNPTHETVRIASVTEGSNGVITVNTTSAHGYTTGKHVYIVGTNSNIDGYKRIESTPSTTSFTVYEDEFQSGTFSSGAATAEIIDVKVTVSGDVTSSLKVGDTFQISGNSGELINNIHSVLSIGLNAGNTEIDIIITRPSRYIPKTVTGFVIDGTTYKLIVTDSSNIKAGQYISASAGLTSSARVSTVSGNLVTLVTGSNDTDFTTAFDPEVPVGVNFLELGSNGYIQVNPFYEVPSIFSITAESVHRLVESLDLRYVRSDRTDSTKLNSGNRVNVAPTAVWDSRGYTTWQGLPVYGTGKSLSGSRSGASILTLDELTSSNRFGINGITDDRRIPVIAPQSAAFGNNNQSGRTLDSLLDYAPKLPLYRPSILRASSHTWEYIGLGSGNYSTGFPNLQTRVLKGYEQFILQSYENGGGFVASTGTNSNGDQFVGNQVIQAGGQSTFTLNVPKVRKSSESNFLETISHFDNDSNGSVDETIHNVENRVANSVINITSIEKKNSAAQEFLKGLSNFFTTSKLSVTDRATIQTLVVNDTLVIANSKISNGDKFPEGSPDGFGFTKAAKPEKTGFISTDTNDRLYVSPKYLDAWRLKRQLLSATNINLDNNRIYVSTLNRTSLNTLDTAQTNSVGLSSSSTSAKVFDTVGLPTNGKLDIEMTLKAISQDTYAIISGSREYFNPSISITVDYDSIDYVDNTITFSNNQNKLGPNTVASYISNILPSGQFKNIIRNWKSPFDFVPSGIDNDGTLFDNNILQGTLNGTFDPSQSVSPTTELTIPVDTSSDFYNKLPDRGSLVIRKKVGTIVYYSTFAYYKNSGIKAVRKIVGFTSDAGLTSYFSGDVVMFGGSSTAVTYADRWSSESPFIPSTDTITEDVDLESATLFTPFEKPIPLVSAVDDGYIENSVPNPVSSKALGINLQTRQSIKTFSPLTSLQQVSDYCRKSGFTSSDNVELLFKPGYYKLNDYPWSRPSFTPSIKINGSGVSRTGGRFGKEIANVSNGDIGGYDNSQTKRADSVNFFKSIWYSPQYVERTDRLYITTEGNPVFNGGVDISNVNFLGLNEAITVNEILDSTYSPDPIIQKARRDVRKAWYVKRQSDFLAQYSDGKLSLTANSTSDTGKATITFITRNDQVFDASGNINTADHTNARFVEFTLVSTNFTGSDANKFNWAKDYVIPGTTIYFGANETPSKVLSRSYNKTSSTETITYTCALFTDENDTHQNIAEDLVLSGYTAGTDYTIKFENIDGDEFTTLAYNLGIYYRTQFIPASKTISGQGDKYGFDEQRYDTPEIFGIIGGYRRGTINLVIDSNPTQPLDTNISSFIIILNQAATSGTNTVRISSSDTNINNLRVGQKVSGIGIGYNALIDSISDDGTNTTITLKDAEGTAVNHVSAIDSGVTLTITPKEIYPFADGYYGCSSIQVFYKDTYNEEYAFTVPVYPNGFKSLFGKSSRRFFLLECYAEDVAIFSDNYNLNIADKLRNIDITTTNFDETINISSDESFIVIAKKNLNLLLDGENPYRQTSQTSDTIDTTTAGIVNALAVRGKQIAINWPHSYKSLRRTIATAHAPSIGNTSTPFIEVSAVPGSDVPLSIKNTTFGALSPYNRQSNTYGGGYFGGLIKTRGAAIRFIGNRIRGNVTTNWSSLLFVGGDAYNTTSRVLPGAYRLKDTQRFTYGHSVDFLQHEESNLFRELPNYTPTKRITVGKNDELFNQVTEYYPEGLNYLEPNYTADNKKVDYDYRVLPINTIQRIPRQLDNGNINNTVILEEFKLTANAIEYGSTTTGKSGWNLRYNDTKDSIAGGGSDGSATLPKNSLQFNYTDTNVVSQLFPNFTKIVKSDNKTTIFATVTKVTKDESSSPYVVTVEYEGSLNFNGYTSTTPDDVNVADLPTIFEDLSIKFSTQFINSERFQYTGGATSRYQKSIANSASSFLILSNDNNTNVAAQHSDLVINKVGSGVASVSYDTVRDLINSRSGTSNAKARIETDSIGNVTKMSIISLGSGHLENDTLIVDGVGDGINGYSIRVNRTLSDDISVFEDGEYFAVPPKNCFILNNINSGSISGIKSEIQRSKLAFKPGSYIKYDNGSSYFKISQSTTYQPYLGVYRYLNPNNRTDIRVAIVVILEETTAAPTYPSNQRFDIYDKENILDYWPTSGRITLGEVETCDYTLSLSSDVYTLNLQRSNVKYYPSYMHDFEGLDPNDSADANVTVGDLQATIIRFADPVDVSSNTFKRINTDATNSTAGLYNLTLSSSFMDPYARYDDKIGVLEVPSSDVNQDFEKFDIGQVVTIPYRDLLYRDGYGDVRYYGGYGPYSNITFEVTSAAKAGSQEIVGNITVSDSTPVDLNVEFDSVNANGNRVESGSNRFVCGNHPFHSGDKVRLTTNGTLPGGLAVDTDYYIVKLDYWGFAFATSLQNVYDGVYVDLTDDGTGKHTVTPQSLRIFWDLRWQPHMVVPETSADSTVFDSLNPLATFRSRQYVAHIDVATGVSNITLYFDQALIGDISIGTKFKMVPGFTQERFHMAGIFKSRIIDIEKSTGKLKLYLADRLPYELTSDIKNTARHFGFFIINNGGWSFPRQNFSSFRTNNIRLGDGKYEIKLPNRSGRIKKGDLLTYNYESNTSQKSTAVVDTPENQNYVIFEDASDIAIGDQLSNYTKLSIPSDLAANATQISIPGHGLTTGDEITYVAGRDASNLLQVITGLSHKENYYVRVISTSAFELYTDVVSAYENTVANRITFTAGNTLTNQSLVRNSLSYASKVVDMTDENVFNTTSRKFTIANHGFTDKEAVTVRAIQVKTSSTVSWNDQTYYVNLVSATDQNEFYLRSTLENWPTTPGTDLSAPTEVDYVILDVKTIVREKQFNYVYIGRFNENNLSGDGQINPTTVLSNIGRSSSITVTGNPDLRTVSSTVIDVQTGSNTDGYQTIILSNPNNILYSSYSLTQNFFSVSDILVTHLSDRMKYGGPTMNTFLYTRNGGKLSFADYGINNTWWGSYYGNAKGWGPYGRMGWTGNFGSRPDGSKVIGSSAKGALELSWNKQRNNSLWAVSSPVRPSWSLWQWDWARQVSFLQPSIAEYHSVGYDLTFNRWWKVASLERDGWEFFNPIKHINRDSVSLYSYFNTGYIKNRKEAWGGPGFWRSGSGAYDVQNYRFPTPNTIKNEWTPIGGEQEIQNRIILSCELQDFEIYNSGWPNWGKGNRTISNEQIRLKYVQHYKPCLSDNLLLTNSVYKNVNSSDRSTKEFTFGNGETLSFADTAVNDLGRRFIPVNNHIDFWGYIDCGAALYDDQNRFVGYFVDWFWGKPYNNTQDYTEKLYLEISEINTDLPTDWSTSSFRVINPAAPMVLSSTDLDEMDIDQTTTAGQKNGGKVYLSATSGGTATTPYVLPPNQQNMVGRNSYDPSTYPSNYTEQIGIPFSRHYNFAFRIDGRGYNNTPQLSTDGISPPVARNWIGHRVMKFRYGDLTNFEWSPMNLMVTKYNKKIHNDESTIAASNTSDLGVETIYI